MRKSFIMPEGMVDKSGYLVPRCGRKSYHCKARVLPLDTGDGCLLVSYNTVVAVYQRGKFFRTWDGWSVTSARHIKSFCIWLGVPTMNKAKWDALPVENMHTLFV